MGCKTEIFVLPRERVNELYFDDFDAPLIDIYDSLIDCTAVSMYCQDAVLFTADFGGLLTSAAASSAAQ